MRALLLSAGLGTRLGPYTESVPKCMVQVAGRPLVARTVEWLRDRGIDDLTMNLHHRPEVIERYFGDGSSHGVRMRYSYEPELLGTAGALLPPRSRFAGDRFLVVYADNLIQCDLDRLTSLHEDLHAILTIALFAREDVSASGVAEVDDRGRVHAFREKPRPDEIAGNWVSAGLLLCEPRVLDYVPQGQASDFGTDVLPAIIGAGETVGGYRMGAEESLLWIDTPTDLASADELLRRREAIV